MIKAHVLAVLGYLLATFSTQAVSHFLVFSHHYAQVTFIKADPIFALGILSMIVQGTVLSVVYANSSFAGKSISSAVKCAWLFGAFLVSYIALAEAAKFEVPNIASWIGVEVLAGAAQFTVAGILIGYAHRVRK